jgi:hypothetical protein
MASKSAAQSKTPAFLSIAMARVLQDPTIGNAGELKKIFFIHRGVVPKLKCPPVTTVKMTA